MMKIHGLGYTALEALRQWRFEPATLDGAPIPVIFNVTINFQLR
jgi:outer membrane biosynthesis protein TonB